MAMSYSRSCSAGDLTYPSVTAPRRDTPAPRRDTPAPRRDTPAPRRDTPAPRRDTPAPRRDTPAPRRDTPAPRRHRSRKLRQNADNSKKGVTFCSCRVGSAEVFAWPYGTAPGGARRPF